MEVTVSQRPASITAPANNSTFIFADPVTITVNAFSANGTIAKIDIFDGETQLTSFVPDGAYNQITYNFIWSTSTAGSHNLTAVVTDSLNTTTTSSVVTVQALAPPSVGLSKSGKYFIAPAYIDLYSNASAAAGSTLSKVEIFNGSTLIATLTTPPFNYTWGNVAAGAYTLTAKATDNLGATMTSTPIDIIVGTAPTISVASGLDGSSVNDNHFQLRGTIETPPNSAVNVNGVLATVTADGGFFVNNVPLQQGSNTLKATVTTMNGETATQTITVNSTATAPFSFSAGASQAIGSSVTSFTLNNQSNVQVGRIELRCVDGGAVSATVTEIESLSGTQCIYGSPGIYTARVNVFSQSGSLIYTATQALYVSTVQEVAKTVRSVYTGLIGRLVDGNTTSALNAFLKDNQQHYSNIFTNLGSDLPAAAAQLGQISRLNLTGDMAEVVLLRNVDGNVAAFFVYLVLGDDGIWRIDSM